MEGMDYKCLQNHIDVCNSTQNTSHYWGLGIRQVLVLVLELSICVIASLTCNILLSNFMCLCGFQAQLGK